jgi:hypothetical protein
VAKDGLLFSAGASMINSRLLREEGALHFNISSPVQAKRFLEGNVHQAAHHSPEQKDTP